ncbi:unnamed protein product [Spodoptera exigua]|nr:unnamed protein product [Spodoptera exigua]
MFLSAIGYKISRYDEMELSSGCYVRLLVKRASPSRFYTSRSFNRVHQSRRYAPSLDRHAIFFGLNNEWNDLVEIHEMALRAGPVILTMWTANEQTDYLMVIRDLKIEDENGGERIGHPVTSLTRRNTTYIRF